MNIGDGSLNRPPAPHTVYIGHVFSVSTDNKLRTHGQETEVLGSTGVEGSKQSVVPTRQMGKREYMLIVSLTVLEYLLTPWNRVLEKQTDSQLVKKSLVFYETRRFITTFTNAHHLSLSSSRSIQSMPLHPTSCRSI